jgi:hypothetical protein
MVVSVVPRPQLDGARNADLARLLKDKTLLHDYNVDDTPVDGATKVPISSNYMYDHVAAADPHTGYVLESAVDDTPVNNATTDPISSNWAYDHAALILGAHGLPADPNADKYLMWDDDPGQLVWADAAGGGDVATDAIWDEQGDIAYGTGANTAAVLAHGTAGQVLISGGHAANPSWSSSPTFSQAITDNVPVTVDDASAADDDLCYFTANGIEGVAITGATLPAAGKAGRFFAHAPTGRKIVYYDDGANWQPVISLGAMTVYVDKTDGTDDTAHGTAADASAFKTVQYAVNTIPGLVGGNVIIYINNETYAEVVTIQGKTFTGNYSITFQGTINSQATAAQDSSVQGATSTMGSITDAGAFGAYDNMLLYSSNNAEYRIIDSDTVNAATICGYWSAAPAGNYTIYDWGTQIKELILKSGQLGIYCYDIKFYGPTTTTYCLDLNPYSEVSCYRCYFTTSDWHVIRIIQSRAAFYTCYFNETVAGGFAGYIGYNSVVSAQTGCKIYVSGASGRGFFCTMGAKLDILASPNVFDGVNKANSNNALYSNASGFIYTGAAYNIIRNWNVGILADQGGQTVGTANNQYATNNTNESATAASYGYID